jgi:hypothetical protein
MIPIHGMYEGALKINQLCWVEFVKGNDMRKGIYTVLASMILCGSSGAEYMGLTDSFSVEIFSNQGDLLFSRPLIGTAAKDGRELMDLAYGDFLLSHPGNELIVLRDNENIEIFPDPFNGEGALRRLTWNGLATMGRTVTAIHMDGSDLLAYLEPGEVPGYAGYRYREGHTTSNPTVLNRVGFVSLKGEHIHAPGTGMVAGKGFYPSDHKSWAVLHRDGVVEMYAGDSTENSMDLAGSFSAEQLSGGKNIATFGVQDELLVAGDADNRLCFFKHGDSGFALQSEVQLKTASKLAGIVTYGPADIPLTERPMTALEAGFVSPSREYRPVAWWHWINGNITKEGIRADLEDMKRAGLGGAQILDVEIYLPPGPVRYGTPEWFEMVQVAVDTADELGLTMGMANCPGWSESGGPWIPPEKSMKKLVWTETPVPGGAMFRGQLDTPETNLNFYRDVAVLAVPDKEVIPLQDIVDLTSDLGDGGRLNWAVPDGDWTVFRFGYTSTGAKNHPAQPEGTGLEVDKMDAEAVAFQFENAMGQIIRNAGSACGEAFNTLLIDSWECGRSSWTEKFPELFRESRGYDIRSYLPVLAGKTVESRQQTDAFMIDYRSALSDGIIDQFFNTLTGLSAEHGLDLMAETYACKDFDQYRAGEVITHTASEFWVHSLNDGAGPLKKAASVAHTLGRNLVPAEAFSARPADGRWLPVPSTLKAVGDLAFVQGITQLLLHSYVHQPRSDIWPGFTLGRYGTHFGRLNPYWEFSRPWVDYLSRCQFMLRQGSYCADYLVLLPSDTHFLYHEPIKTMPDGFANDTVTKSILMTAEVENGQIVLPGGMKYRILLLPTNWTASADLLEKIAYFVDQKVPVFGPPPRIASGLFELENGKDAWSKRVSLLWGNGKDAQIPRDSNPEKIAHELILNPDFQARNKLGSSSIRWIHRRTPSEDIYFIANLEAQPARFLGEFRVTGRQPEFWNPVSGTMLPAAVFEDGATVTSVNMELPSNGSVFVVFRHPVPLQRMTSIVAAGCSAPLSQQECRLSEQHQLVFDHAGAYQLERSGGVVEDISVSLPEPLRIQGPWSVHFVPMLDRPFDRVFPDLVSWPEHSDEPVRFFSGKAVYQTKFTLPAVDTNLIYRLELGEVCDIAEVHVNGERAGIAWTAPFSVDVTPFLQEGDNELKVTVANRAVNRLIGDEQFPPDAEYQAGGSEFTNGRLLSFPDWFQDPALLRNRQRRTFSTWTFYTKESPLVPAGLLGPVRLTADRVISRL